ncbi:unnamed protein product, partial [Haemonchus placei]|uniref:C2 DOCK-type domain-containing protein n=1 Tax=Haemonchus placei TaxID=6290 RepID=A0A0N4WV51_HAEPC
VSNFAANEELIENAASKKAPCCFLNLIAGDRICVFAEKDGWAIGSRVGSRADAGLFPLVAVKFVNRHSQTDPTAEGANIVEEISQVTQIWWRKIKVDANEKTPKAFCVLLRVQSIELQMKQNCEISMVLYDFERKQHASDTFAFIWKSNETNSRDLNISGLFANFNQSDIGRRLVLITRVARIAPVEHTSSTLRRNQEPGPTSLYCRQVFAFDFFDMTSVFTNPQPSHDAKDKVIFLNKDQNFDQLLKSLQTTAKVPKLSASSDDGKILISTQVYTNGLSELKLRRPYLFTRNPPTIISRCDYAGPASGEVRNDLYVTLIQGEFTSKSSERNIEARMHLVEGNGRIVPDCFETVSTGSMKLSSEYRSFVYIHEDKPVWFENVKSFVFSKPYLIKSAKNDYWALLQDAL